MGSGGYRITLLARRTCRADSHLTREVFMATGKAAVLVGPGKGYEIQEFEVPAPEPGGVVIKVSMGGSAGRTCTSGGGTRRCSRRWRGTWRGTR